MNVTHASIDVSGEVRALLQEALVRPAKERSAAVSQTLSECVAAGGLTTEQAERIELLYRQGTLAKALIDAGGPQADAGHDAERDGMRTSSFGFTSIHRVAVESKEPQGGIPRISTRLRAPVRSTIRRIIARFETDPRMMERLERLLVSEPFVPGTEGYRRTTDAARMHMLGQLDVEDGEPGRLQWADVRTACCRLAAAFSEASLDQGTLILFGGSPNEVRVNVLLGRIRGDETMLLDHRAGSGHATITIDQSEPRVEDALARCLALIVAGTHGMPSDTAITRARIQIALEHFFDCAHTHEDTEMASERASLAEALEQLVATVDEEALDPLTRARLDKFRYLTSPEYRPDAPGHLSGIRVHGTDTKPTTGSVGHVMMTHMEANELGGQHFSFSGMGLQRRRALGMKSSELGRIGVVGAYRGGPAAMNVRLQPGELLSFRDDPHVFHPKTGDAITRTFDFGLDPGFVPPVAFNRAVLRTRASAEATAQGLNYILATLSSPPEGADLVELDDGSLGVRVAGVEPDVPRVVPIDEAGGYASIQAHNCVMSLVRLLATVRSRDGQPVLDSNDFEMLGLTRNGLAYPGHDITPQKLYEHLRWKQHRMETLDG